MEVCLDVSLDQYPDTLSGGEKQRLAIACVLIKDPDLIIADEPTSALDDDNTKNVMTVLKNIAKKGKSIIIATHSSYVANEGDVLYRIENKGIHLVRGEIDRGIKQSDYKENKLTYQFYNHYLKSLHSSKKEKIILSILSSICIAIVSISLFSLPVMRKNYDNLLNTVSDKSIIINKYNNMHEKIEFNEKEVSYFNELKDVEFVAPINSYKGFGITINGEVLPFEYDIVPYFPFEIENNKFEWIDRENSGVVLSSILGTKLDIDSNINVSVNQDFLLEPLNVVGVYHIDVNSYYTDAKNIIYVPYNMLPKNEASTFLLQANDYKACITIRDKISQVDKNYDVILPFNYYSTILDMMSSYSSTLLNSSITILIVVIILTCISNVYEITNKKLELCILRANGLTQKEVLKMMIINYFKNITLDSIITITLTIIGLNVFMLLLSIDTVLLSPLLFLGTIVITLSINIIPSIATVLYINKFSPEKTLRD